jgi:hypothetical protein
LARGWWQGATWTRAHPFLSSGRWKTPGGDLVDGVAAVSGLHSDSGVLDTVEFEVKDWVTESIEEAKLGEITALYGFRIEGASGADLAFHSAQSDWGESYWPQLKFTYTGPCVR